LRGVRHVSFEFDTECNLAKQHNDAAPREFVRRQCQRPETPVEHFGDSHVCVQE